MLKNKLIVNKTKLQLKLLTAVTQHSRNRYFCLAESLKSIVMNYSNYFKYFIYLKCIYKYLFINTLLFTIKT